MREADIVFGQGGQPGEPALARMTPMERWVVAVWLFLAALAVWLEFAGVPPARPAPVFATAAAVAVVICGVPPGLAVVLAGAGAAWWFTLPGVGQATVTAATALAAAGGAAAVRRWLLRRG